MRVALAAIADDGDLLSLDQIEIGIPIVIDAHELFPCPTCCNPMIRRVCAAPLANWQVAGSLAYIRSAPREMAARPVRETSTRPSGCISTMNCSILDCLPVISKMKCSVEASITEA